MNIQKEVIERTRGFVRYSNPNSDYRHLLFIAGAMMTLLTNLWLVVCATISAFAQDGKSSESADKVSFLCGECGCVANAEEYCPVCGSSFVYRTFK